MTQRERERERERERNGDTNNNNNTEETNSEEKLLATRCRSSLGNSVVDFKSYQPHLKGGKPKKKEKEQTEMIQKHPPT
jgi:hypothetical protein